MNSKERLEAEIEGNGGWRDMQKGLNFKIQSLEARLSHLMDEKAELNKKCESLALELDGHKVAMGCVTSDEKASMGFWGRSCARLSIKNKLLMDVVGKMAGALQNCHGTLDDSRIGTWMYMEGSEIYRDFDKAKAIAKTALAEWDGIKK